MAAAAVFYTLYIFQMVLPQVCVAACVAAYYSAELALRRVEAHCREAAVHLASQAQALDLLAEELRLAQGALSDITGEFSSDDLLGVIFSQFCIGK